MRFLTAALSLTWSPLRALWLLFSRWKHLVLRLNCRRSGSECGGSFLTSFLLINPSFSLSLDYWLFPLAAVPLTETGADSAKISGVEGGGHCASGHNTQMDVAQVVNTHIHCRHYTSGHNTRVDITQVVNTHCRHCTSRQYTTVAQLILPMPMPKYIVFMKRPQVHLLK